MSITVYQISLGQAAFCQQLQKIEQHLAPRVGFEPTTIRLTVGRSTTELPRNAVQNAGERSA